MAPVPCVSSGMDCPVLVRQPWSPVSWEGNGLAMLTIQSLDVTILLKRFAEVVEVVPFQSRAIFRFVWSWIVDHSHDLPPPPRELWVLVGDYRGFFLIESDFFLLRMGKYSKRKLILIPCILAFLKLYPRSQIRVLMRIPKWKLKIKLFFWADLHSVPWYTDVKS